MTGTFGLTQVVRDGGSSCVVEEKPFSFVVVVAKLLCCFNPVSSHVEVGQLKDFAFFFPSFV